MRSESAAQVETVRTESAAQVEAVTASFRELAGGLPGIVLELVQGDTVEAVQASVAAAREAYNRVPEGVTASLTTVGQQPGAGSEEVAAGN